MKKRIADGNVFYHMIASGTSFLAERVETVNALNVFPVPDGDTGSNMSRTIEAGLAALSDMRPAKIGEAAKCFSSGLLMGARGNSGVILSQLFRGFAQALEGHAEADTVLLAQAMQKGVETAYKAVIKPVEGTILTVAKDGAQAAVEAAKRLEDLDKWLEYVCSEMEASLRRTPDLLPILKKVGVVDSGGQGLLFIYEGMLAALKENGQALSSMPTRTQAKTKTESGLFTEALSDEPVAAPVAAQAKIDSEDIDFIYDMEFFIRVSTSEEGEKAADELRHKLASIGDSVLVIADDRKVKVHVHANFPGDVLNEAIRYGELTDIHILNMRDQHREAAKLAAVQAPGHPSKKFGLVAVATGDGVADIFTSLGADVVIHGGQTMNPSTADIVKAVEQTEAQCVFVLPNNPNIVLAAEQAATVSDREIIVIPTRTIPQGMAAALAFEADQEREQLEKNMVEASQRVKSGSVTYAVRDSQIGALTIRKDDFLGMVDNKIVVADADLIKTCEALLNEMIDHDDEIMTVLVGAEVDEESENRVARLISERYPDIELDWHRGGQPLYPFIFSVE